MPHVRDMTIEVMHRSGIQQYLKDKPTKWGIKLWVLADSANGYTVDFNIYIGRDAAREISKFGLGYDVVMDHLFDTFCMFKAFI